MTTEGGNLESYRKPEPFNSVLPKSDNPHKFSESSIQEVSDNGHDNVKDTLFLNDQREERVDKKFDEKRVKDFYNNQSSNLFREEIEKKVVEMEKIAEGGESNMVFTEKELNEYPLKSILKKHPHIYAKLNIK